MIYSLARSGATLISRCLGCMPGHVLLSEVNPRWAWFNPLAQAKDWFKLISDEELSQLKQSGVISYLDAIRLISSKCEARGLNLIIRDWSHVDFTPGPYPVPPIYHLAQYDLLKTRFDIKHIAIVRHPLDSFLSLAHLFDYRGRLDYSIYLQGFRKFAEIASQFGYVRYEDFCDNPTLSMEHICEALELHYDPTFLARYNNYQFVTGDHYPAGQTLTLTGELIGERVSTNAIRRPSRRPAPPALLKLIGENQDYLAILKLLGYPRNLDSV